MVFLFVTVLSVLPAALCTVIYNVQHTSLVKFLRDLNGATPAYGVQISHIQQCAFWNCVGGGLNRRGVFLMDGRGSLRWTHFLIYVTRFPSRDEQFPMRSSR
jgi:hypothetical protein